MESEFVGSDCAMVSAGWASESAGRGCAWVPARWAFESVVLDCAKVPVGWAFESLAQASTVNWVSAMDVLRAVVV